MAVYVDDMFKSPIGEFGRMKMSHMIADTHAELVEMADKIGVSRRWIQQPGNFREHFDICMSKRARALRSGAIEISWLELSRLCDERRADDGEARYFATPAAATLF